MKFGGSDTPKPKPKVIQTPATEATTPKKTSKVNIAMPQTTGLPDLSTDTDNAGSRSFS